MGEFLPLVHLQTWQGHTLPGHQQCTGGGNGRHGPRHGRSLLDLPVRSTSGNKSLIEILKKSKKNEDFSNVFIAKSCNCSKYYGSCFIKGQRCYWKHYLLLLLCNFRYTGTCTRAINFGSYNYLGFSENKGPCADAVERTVNQLGNAICASRQELGKVAIYHFISLFCKILPYTWTERMNAFILDSLNCLLLLN